MEGKGWMDGGKKKDGHEQDERKGKRWMKGEKKGCIEREGVDGKETKDVKSRRNRRWRARDRNLMEKVGKCKRLKGKGRKH